MFKEIKHIAGNPNQIKNQLELRQITEDAKVDRTETCFGGQSRQTWKDYVKGKELAKEAARRFF